MKIMSEKKSLSKPCSGPVFNCLFVLRLNVPVNNFSVMSGWSPALPGFNQYCRSCSRTQHDDACGDRTSRFGVRRSTPTPLRSLEPIFMDNIV